MADGAGDISPSWSIQGRQGTALMSELVRRITLPVDPHPVISP
jgi:hypothetical protein